MNSFGLALGVGAPAVSAPAWTPASLNGLVLWLRADLGVTQVANAVSSWADQSGQGHTFSASGAAQPTLTATGGPNSLPCIAFNGASNVMSSASPVTTVAQNWSEWIIVQLNAGGISRPQ